MEQVTKEMILGKIQRLIDDGHKVISILPSDTILNIGEIIIDISDKVFIRKIIVADKTLTGLEENDIREIHTLLKNQYEKQTEEEVLNYLKS